MNNYKNDRVKYEITEQLHQNEPQQNIFKITNPKCLVNV